MVKEIKLKREKKKIKDYLSSLIKGMSPTNHYHYYSHGYVNTTTKLYIEHKPYKWVHIREGFISDCGIGENIPSEQKQLIEEIISDYYNLVNYEFKGL